jgi:dihydroorotate dehydrogenase (NAD+) catalytic subunit
MGLPNPGIDEFREEIKEVKQSGTRIPLIASVYGFSTADFVKVGKVVAEAGADALELNVSCPHVKETGAEIGQNQDLVAEVVREMKKNVKKPVFVKLTPNVADVAGVARAAGPILANKFGGLSGPAIKPIAVRCVYEIYREVDVPIVGCGGVTSWQDAIEFMLAGASAVQIGTAIATRGLGVFKLVSRGINIYLKRKGFRGVKEIVGLSHRG